LSTPTTTIKDRKHEHGEIQGTKERLARLEQLYFLTLYSECDNGDIVNGEYHNWCEEESIAGHED